MIALRWHDLTYSQETSDFVLLEIKVVSTDPLLKDKSQLILGQSLPALSLSLWMKYDPQKYNLMKVESICAKRQTISHMLYFHVFIPKAEFMYICIDMFHPRLNL